MEELILYAGVFIGAAIPMLEVWVAVPLGVIAGLPWIPAALVGFAGNFVSLLPVIYAGEKVKHWVNRWTKRSDSGKVSSSSEPDGAKPDGADPVSVSSSSEPGDPVKAEQVGPVQDGQESGRSEPDKLEPEWGGPERSEPDTLKTERPESGKKSRSHRIMERFGVPGLALLGPFVIGIHAATAFAMAMGVDKRDVLFWFSLSLLLCSLLFGLLASLGFTQMTDGHQLPGV